MDSRYLIIYNDSKIIYAGLEEQIEKMWIKPGCHFEICADNAEFNKKIDTITQEIMNRTPDPNPDYKRLIEIVREIEDISNRIYNNYYHILNFGDDDVELIRENLEESAQQIRDTIDDFCLLKDN